MGPSSIGLCICMKFGHTWSWCGARMEGGTVYVGVIALSTSLARWCFSVCLSVCGGVFVCVRRRLKSTGDCRRYISRRQWPFGEEVRWWCVARRYRHIKAHVHSHLQTHPRNGLRVKKCCRAIRWSLILAEIALGRSLRLTLKLFSICCQCNRWLIAAAGC